MNERPVKGTILFIDDEAVIRELAKEILETGNYRVILAKHGNDGVRLFNEKQESIDLVVLDMVMPEKGGKQVFEEIRSIRPDAKILLCSGYGPEQYFHELFEGGAAGFLQKPFSFADLVGKVEKALGG